MVLAGSLHAEIRFNRLQILITLNVSFIFKRATQHELSECFMLFRLGDYLEGGTLWFA